MTKHIFTDASSQSSVEQGALQVANLLRPLVAAWDNLGIGPFSEELLSGNQVKHQSGGCQACKGLKTYSKADVFIQDYLLDQAGQVEVSGLRISRDRMREMIELPAAAKVKAFEEAFTQYTQGLRRTGHSPFVKIQEGKVVILQDALAKSLQRYEKHLSSAEDIVLFEDLEKFIALASSINARLARKGIRKIKFDKTNDFNAPVSLREDDVDQTNLYLNNRVLSAYLR